MDCADRSQAFRNETINHSHQMSKRHANKEYEAAKERLRLMRKHADKHLRRQRKKHQLERHHRKPTSIGGKEEERNYSYIPNFQHQAWHAIVSNHSAQTICFILNEKFLDSDFKFICVPEAKYDEARQLVASL